MKIAVLSDIHGNSVALAAVLREVQRMGIARLFLLGDYVGYFYDPTKVLDLLQPWNKVMIKGNHETFLSEEYPEINQEYGHGIEIAKKALTKEQINFLVTLPNKKKVELDNLTFLLCHGSPQDPNEYVYPDAPEEVLDRCAQGADFVLIGHTHHAFIYKGKDSILVNPGSVGLPRDVPFASWAIIDTANREVSIQRTTFNMDKNLQQVREQDPDKLHLFKMFRGKNV